MSNETKPIRVLLVDDHAFMLEVVKSFLHRQRRFEVVGEAFSGPEAVRKTRELLPDVVVMDMAMPGMSGIEAARCLHATCPQSRVLFLTANDKQELIAEMMRAGARGCVRKNSPPSELTAAIERVQAGGLAFEADLSLSVEAEPLGRVAPQMGSGLLHQT